jgi:Uma2 family endonuclease
MPARNASCFTLASSRCARSRRRASTVRAGSDSSAAYPAGLELDAFTLVQPDVYVLPLVHGRRPRTADEVAQPLLLVEVLSPGTARVDRVVKRQRYQQLGTEYWIVDLDARVVERWLPADARPEVITDTLAWATSPASAACEVHLPRLFAEVLGAL